MAVLLLSLSIVFNTTANILFKAAGATQDLTMRKGMVLGIGLLIGLANTVCFIKALEKIDLGTAYAVFSAASIVLIGAVSPIVFGEQMSIQKAVGLAVICAGLFLTWKA
jgi:multidrug transporter EmrE-like cation transporter